MSVGGAFDFSDLDRPQYRDIYLYQRVGLDFTLPFSLLQVDNYNDSPSRHRYFQIIYILKGSMRHSMLRWEVEAEPGDLFLIPPYIPHRLTAEEPGGPNQIFELEFPPEFLLDEALPGIFETTLFDFSGLCPENDSAVPPRAAQRIRLGGEARQFVEQILRGMETEYKNRFIHCDCMLMLRAQTMLLLVYLNRYLARAEPDASPVSERERGRLMPAIRYLHDNFTQPRISVDTLCRAAAMSPAAFWRAFRRLTGKTPVEYIHTLRIEQAVRLLRSRTDSTVAEIAFSCGFQSPAHFNRVFKSLTGVTPSSLRR